MLNTKACGLFSVSTLLNPPLHIVLWTSLSMPFPGTLDSENSNRVCCFRVAMMWQVPSHLNRYRLFDSNLHDNPGKELLFSHFISEVTEAWGDDITWLRAHSSAEMQTLINLTRAPMLWTIRPEHQVKLLLSSISPAPSLTSLPSFHSHFQPLKLEGLCFYYWPPGTLTPHTGILSLAPHVQPGDKPYWCQQHRHLMSWDALLSLSTANILSRHSSPITWTISVASSPFLWVLFFFFLHTHSFLWEKKR